MSKKKTEEEPELETASEETPEAKNVYTYATSSTTEATISPDDFWRIKLST